MTCLVGFPPWKPYPAKFSGHLSCETWDNFFKSSRDQEDHVIEESSKFMSANHSRKSPYS